MIESEASIRLLAFAGSLLLLAAAEALWPRRAVVRGERWLNNLALAALNTLLLRFLFPVLAVGWAMTIENQGWGLLQILAPRGWLQLALAVILLDLAIYWQHRAFHMIPWCWRLHRLHHSDIDFDFTTGVRFHPGEILLSMLIKFAVIALLGAPALAVLVFEIILSSSSLFEHANLRLPRKLDRALRTLIVTPDMHRVHHSVFDEELNRNFGFNFSLWDRLFGSYHAQPRDGHLGMHIGLTRFRTPAEQHLGRLLVQPLVNDDSAAVS